MSENKWRVLHSSAGTGRPVQRHSERTDNERQCEAKLLLILHSASEALVSLALKHLLQPSTWTLKRLLKACLVFVAVFESKCSNNVFLRFNNFFFICKEIKYYTCTVKCTVISLSAVWGGVPAVEGTYRSHPAWRCTWTCPPR